MVLNSIVKSYIATISSKLEQDYFKKLISLIKTKCFDFYLQFDENNDNEEEEVELEEETLLDDNNVAVNDNPESKDNNTVGDVTEVSTSEGDNTGKKRDEKAAEVESDIADAVSTIKVKPKGKGKTAISSDEEELISSKNDTTTNEPHTTVETPVTEKCTEDHNSGCNDNNFDQSESQEETKEEAKEETNSGCKGTNTEGYDYATAASNMLLKTDDVSFSADDVTKLQAY